MQLVPGLIKDFGLIVQKILVSLFNVGPVLICWIWLILCQNFSENYRKLWIRISCLAWQWTSRRATFVFADFLLNHLWSELYLVTVTGLESDQSVYSRALPYPTAFHKDFLLSPSFQVSSATFLFTFHGRQFLTLASKLIRDECVSQSQTYHIISSWSQWQTPKLLHFFLLLLVAFFIGKKMYRICLMMLEYIMIQSTHHVP